MEPPKGAFAMGTNVILVMPHAILASALMVTCVQQCVARFLTVPAVLHRFQGGRLGMRIKL